LGGGRVIKREVLGSAGVLCAAGFIVFAVAALGASPVPINNAVCTIYPTAGASPQTGFCSGTVNLNPNGNRVNASPGSQNRVNANSGSGTQANANPVIPNALNPFQAKSRGSFVWGVVALGLIALVIAGGVGLRVRRRPGRSRRKHLTQ